jgi:leucyl-tRNA synthetase
MYRFLGRFYRFATRNAEKARAAKAAPGERNGADRKALRKLHQTLNKITGDFESRWHYNTSIAGVMELMNELQPLEAQLSPGAVAEILETMILMLAPFVPYVTQELWEELGREGLVFRQAWPEYDAEVAKEDELEIPVQVNGKLRGKVRVAPGIAKDALESVALGDDKIQGYIQGKQVVKIVVVPDKLVNVVVKG